jgi:hypothetical protein
MNPLSFILPHRGGGIGPKTVYHNSSSAHISFLGVQRNSLLALTINFVFSLGDVRSDQVNAAYNRYLGKPSPKIPLSFILPHQGGGIDFKTSDGHSLGVDINFFGDNRNSLGANRNC